MLIEFRVENYRSIRDEQVLTLEAANIGDDTDLRPRKVAGHDKKLLPAAALYGANASGKSTVLAALAFMTRAVGQSHRQWAPDGGFPRPPFAWGEKRKEPSLFEATFLVGGKKVQYGFVVDDESVLEEWLYVWPESRKQTWFERDGQDFKFGEHLKGQNEVMKEITRTNSLFLSAAAQNNHEQLRPVFSWFSNVALEAICTGRNLDHRFDPLYFPLVFPKDAQGQEIVAKRMLALMQLADVGIVGFKLGRTGPPHEFLFQHQIDDENSWLPLESESEGTKTLFSLAGPLFRVLSSGSLLVIDELESSLHPLLGLKLLQMFNSPETNPKNAQILFTTHDTNLLGGTLGDPPLRRDQIWFTEKDKEGATTLYPLTDYKPRKAENLERGYLQGRYGAIPFLGDLPHLPE